MVYEEYNYVGFKNSLREKTKITKIEDIQESSDRENYRTIYRFTDELLQYDSVANLDTSIKFYADYIVFDIDRDHITDAIEDGNKLVDFLDSVEVDCQIYFSGSKGFHILVPTVSFGFQPTNNPKVLRYMAVALAEKAGIKIDESIYNVTRVLRTPLSLNNKSGSRKIPVKIITEGYVETDEYPEDDDYGLSEFMVELYKKILRFLDKKSSQVVVSDKNILKEVDEGGRNVACYSLARELKKKRLNQESVIEIVRLYNNDKCNPPLSDREVNSIVISAFRGETIYEPEEGFSKREFFDTKRIVKETHESVKDLGGKVIKTGYEFFDAYTMGLYPGDILFWVATNGNFKTCVLSNLLKGITKTSKKPTLLFSLDMDAKALAIRHIQCSENLTYTQVINKAKKNDPFKKFCQEFEGVYIVDKKMASVEECIDYVEWAKGELGEIGAIGFDYLGAFRGCDNDSLVTGKTIHEIDYLAKKVGKCPIITLVQARREYEGNGGNCEVDKTAGKDSSVIEQKADYLIGSWWHNEQQPNGEYVKKRYGRFLKNRKFNSDLFSDTSYFNLDICEKYMQLKSINLESQPPSFKQKTTYK